MVGLFERQGGSNFPCTWCCVCVICIQLLFIDDFAISRYSEDGIKILYHLIKTRTDLGTSTMFTSQYAPSEWGRHLSDEEGCYGKLDGIRRRLTTGYTVHIEKL